MIKIERVANIYSKDFFPVHVLDGVSKIKYHLLKTGIKACPVIEDGKLVGTITSDDLLKAHPNRIIADAMCKKIVTISPDISLWQAHDIFEESEVDVLVIQEEEKILGILPRNLLDIKLGPQKDLLTGLNKSDYIYNQGVNLLNKGQEICIIFLDVNEFGMIDKTYGHMIGDTIIIELSKLLQDNLPHEAFLCRFGGDEFVVLLPAHLDKGATLAYLLADIVARHNFTYGIEITISAGVIGGRRYNERNDNPWETMENLINIASLQSTEAKMNNSIISVTNIYDYNEIA